MIIRERPWVLSMRQTICCPLVLFTMGGTLPILFLLLAIGRVSGALQCYTVDGKASTDTTIVACDSSVTGQTGSHTSCCNKATGDACLSTGLCLGTAAKTADALLWINGCTDPTWRDPACPQYCNPPTNATSWSPSSQNRTVALPQAIS